MQNQLQQYVNYVVEKYRSYGIEVVPCKPLRWYERRNDCIYAIPVNKVNNPHDIFTFFSAQLPQLGYNHVYVNEHLLVTYKTDRLAACYLTPQYALVKPSIFNNFSNRYPAKLVLFNYNFLRLNDLMSFPDLNYTYNNIANLHLPTLTTSKSNHILTLLYLPSQYEYSYTVTLSPFLDARCYPASSVFVSTEPLQYASTDELTCILYLGMYYQARLYDGVLHLAIPKQEQSKKCEWRITSVSVVLEESPINALHPNHVVGNIVKLTVDKVYTRDGLIISRSVCKHENNCYYAYRYHAYMYVKLPTYLTVKDVINFVKLVVNKTVNLRDFNCIHLYDKFYTIHPADVAIAYPTNAALLLQKERSVHTKDFSIDWTNNYRSLCKYVPELQDLFGNF